MATSPSPMQPEPQPNGVEFLIDKLELMRELSNTQGVVERKGTIPILSHFLFETSGNNLMITATDLDLSLRTVCATTTVKKQGSCTVPARKLYEYVRLLPDGEISIKSLANEWVQIRSGRSHTKMVGLGRANFPQLPLFPAPSAISLPKEALRSMISRTIFAISSEESRYTLAGGLLILKPESMTMVATDGHRLAHIQTDASIDLSSETRILIPRKAMAEVHSLLNAEGSDIVQFARNDSHLFFRIGPRLLTSRQLNGVFPSFEKVMPQDLPHSLSLETVEFSKAIQRVSQFADTANTVRIRADKNELRLSSSNAETGESEEVLETTFTGDPLKIGFNSSYLLEFLRVAGTEKITFRLKEANGAAEFAPLQGAASDLAYKYVVMPVRI